MRQSAWFGNPLRGQARDREDVDAVGSLVQHGRVADERGEKRGFGVSRLQV